MWSNLTKRSLRDKIGVSAAVSWVHHGGVETTHLSHIMTFLALEIVPASSHYSASLLGAGPVSSPRGSGVWDPNRVGIEPATPDEAREILRLKGLDEVAY